MIELRFRVWDDRSGFMHSSSEFNQCGYMMKEDYEIMQYTGFKDKTGEDIFEGDVLEVAGGSRITVESLETFLIFCGRYEEKHGVPLFPSVQVVSNVFEKTDG